jgi:capsular polysaccharide biosynthesis protein
MMNFLFAPPSADDLIRLLRAWRFWILGALAGALVGAAVYFVVPPPYRARASVNVDFHLEQAWPQNTDREQFYYLDRETRKLEEIAFSDAVLNPVAAQVSGVGLADMRSGKLQLSQPGNGGWHFFADDNDPRRAAALASAWAKSFATQVHAEVAASSTSGLESFITADADQVQDIPARRLFSLSSYLSVGAAVFLALSALVVLFLHPRAAARP